MKIGNITALDYSVEGDSLRIKFQGCTGAAVEALDGGAVLGVTTDQGDVIALLRGFTLLSVLSMDREAGTVTAVFRHVSAVEDALAAAREELEQLRGVSADMMDALDAEKKIQAAKIKALSDQNDFQEELIVELAGVVYA